MCVGQKLLATPWPLLHTCQEKYIQNTILGKIHIQKIHTQLSSTSQERHEVPSCGNFNFKSGDYYHNIKVAEYIKGFKRGQKIEARGPEKQVIKFVWP